MAKNPKDEVHVNNYLNPSPKIKAHIARIKETAKRNTGREFGTHATRGTSNYEVQLRVTLVEAIRLANEDKRLKPGEKVIVKDRLINDYNYGYKLREQDRLRHEESYDAPVMDRTVISKRMKLLEERKKENIKRVSEKFMQYKNGRPKF